MTAPLSRTEVELCAELAGLRLSAMELEAMRRELGRILVAADELARAAPEVHTTGIAAAAAPVAEAQGPSALRADAGEPGTLLDRETVLAQAPARDGDYFVVPAVLPEPGAESRPEAER